MKPSHSLSSRAFSILLVAFMLNIMQISAAKTCPSDLTSSDACSDKCKEKKWDDTKQKMVPKYGCVRNDVTGSVITGSSAVFTSSRELFSCRCCCDRKDVIGTKCYDKDATSTYDTYDCTLEKPSGGGGSGSKSGGGSGSGSSGSATATKTCSEMGIKTMDDCKKECSPRKVTFSTFGTKVTCKCNNDVLCTDKSGNDGGGGGGIIVVVALILLAVVAGAAFLWYKKQNGGFSDNTGFVKV